MLKDLLKSRRLPPLCDRATMLDILQREEYGFLPPPPDAVTFAAEDIPGVTNFCAGKATLEKVTATCTLGDKVFAFPFYAVLPTDGKPHPFFIHINFRPDVPDRYMPTEELVDNGFAVLSFCYKDVTSDDGDFTDGLAGVLYPDGVRGDTDAGKIAMWAWAAHRVMDYAQTRGDVLRLDAGVVCGHSRLGKTALFTAATDERFAFAHSNNSGCGGAALARENTGERVKDICRTFPFWFCRNYAKYADNEGALPFDQHFLVASVAPRRVMIASAAEDAWADPVSEFLGCVAAGEAFAGGFVCDDRLPQVGDAYLDGDIGYHLRAGLHYFSRADWLRLMTFVKKHIETE